MSPRFIRKVLLVVSMLFFLAAAMFAVAGVIEAKVVRFGGENILFIICVALPGVVLLTIRNRMSTDHWRKLHRD